MGTINVIWNSYHIPEIIPRGYWDQAILEDTFIKGDYNHIYSVNNVPDGEGGIFIINGRTHTEDTHKINLDIQKLPWVLIIITGDEEALFPWRHLRHPNKRVWVQLPRVGLHDEVNYKIPNGYRPQTVETLRNIGNNPKEIDWFFAGQVTHDRRIECVKAAKALNKNYNSKLIETAGFGQEVMPYNEYLEHISRSKVVLCPSGPESPDSFRVYEALEAGCIPIVDAYATNNPIWGFWKNIYGDTPFPVISEWEKLPDLLPEILNNYTTIANNCYSWWQLKKREINNQLIKDIKDLKS